MGFLLLIDMDKTRTNASDHTETTRASPGLWAEAWAGSIFY